MCVCVWVCGAVADGGLGTACECPLVSLGGGQVDPSTVRPVSTLRRAFGELKRRWSTQDNPDYDFVCEQLKTIRQDLSLQGVRDEFTVQVYEVGSGWCEEASCCVCVCVCVWGCVLVCVCGLFVRERVGERQSCCCCWRHGVPLLPSSIGGSLFLVCPLARTFCLLLPAQ